MTYRLGLAIGLLCPLPGLAASPAPTEDLISVTYTCEGAVEVPVVYVNSPDDTGYAVALFEGRLVGMRQAISASGARYRSGEGQDDVELWSKGEQASFSVGPEAESRRIHTDCVAGK